MNKSSVDVAINSTVQFTATVSGVSNTSVTWSVDTISGGNATVGTISSSGLYTAPSQSGAHTVTATSMADSTQSASAQVTVVDLTLTPLAVVVIPGGTQQFTANQSVTWSVDGVAGGNSTIGTISPSGLYTAPNGVFGAHSITATSQADSSISVSSTLTVINSQSGAVLMYHYDDARDGAFTDETILMPSNVTSAHFGKLFSYAVDGQVYAQPLYLPGVTIGGTKRNVIFIATENDSVYTFDADGVQTAPLWQKSLGTPVPKNDQEGVSPLLGITSTPVLDVTTGTQQIDNIFSTPAYWNGLLYYHCENDVLHAFSWANGLLSSQPVSSGSSVLQVHGATASISSNGIMNGIVLEIDNSNYGGSGPSILRAYDASNVTTELYNSSQAGSRDAAGTALKFTVPTIAGGKVFIGTANEVNVYGLLSH